MEHMSSGTNLTIEILQIIQLIRTPHVKAANHEINRKRAIDSIPNEYQIKLAANEVGIKATSEAIEKVRNEIIDGIRDPRRLANLPHYEQTARHFETALKNILENRPLSGRFAEPIQRLREITRKRRETKIQARHSPAEAEIRNAIVRFIRGEKPDPKFEELLQGWKSNRIPINERERTAWRIFAKTPAQRKIIARLQRPSRIKR